MGDAGPAAVPGSPDAADPLISLDGPPPEEEKPSPYPPTDKESKPAAAAVVAAAFTPASAESGEASGAQPPPAEAQSGPASPAVAVAAASFGKPTATPATADSANENVAFQPQPQGAAVEVVRAEPELAPGEKKPGLVARVRGLTVPALLQKLVKLAADVRHNPLAKISKIQTTLNKLTKAIEKYPTPAKDLDAPNNGNRVLVKTVAQLIPPNRLWEKEPAAAGLCIQLIIQILRDLNVKAWDFETSVPENIKAMYPPRTAPGPQIPQTAATTPSAGRASELWKKKAKQVALVQRTVKVMKGIKGISREELQRNFQVLGVNAPLLYAALQLGEDGKPMNEPDMAVQLVEELIKAGADPGRYQEAILLRAIDCKWMACVAALRERCGEDINRLAEEAVAENARKHAIHKNFSGGGSAVVHRPPSAVLRGTQFLKLDLAVATSEHVDYINCVQVAPSGSTLLTACNDGILRIFRTTDGIKVGESDFVSGSLMRAAWSPDGQFVATAGTNGRLRVHDASSDVLPLNFEFEHTNPVSGQLSKLYSVEYSADGRSIATCSHDGILRFFDAKTGELKHTSSDLEDGVFVGTYAAGGTRFLAAWQQQGIVRLFDATNGLVLAEHHISTAAMPHHVSASVNGSRILVACGDGYVKIYSAEDGGMTSELEWHGGAVSSAYFSRDDKHILTATGDGNLRLFDAETSAIIASTACPFDPVWLKEANFGADNQSIAMCSCDGIARLFRFAVVSEDPQNAVVEVQSAASPVPAVAAGDQSDDDDNSDDDNDILAEVAARPSNVRGTDQAEHMYRKLMAAIAQYDDDETEANPENQTLVHMAQSVPQNLLNKAPPKCESPVVVAAAAQKLGALQVLLYSGGNIRARALDGRTLLHVVLEDTDHVDYALAHFLCVAGLSVGDISKGGRSVYFDLRSRGLIENLLSTAKSVEATAVVADLTAAVQRDQGSDTDSEGDEESDHDDDEVLDQEQHDLNFHDAKYAASLYDKLVAAIEAYDDEYPESHPVNEQLVELARGVPAAELNSPPENREPALVVACLNQKLGGASVMIYSGCKVNARSLDGHSLLHVVVSNPSRMNIALAEMLCDLGLSLSDPVGDGSSTVYDDLVRSGRIPALKERAAEVPEGALFRQLNDLDEATVTSSESAANAKRSIVVDVLAEDEV